MKSYNNFIGIDIGKYSFVVAIYGEKATKEYENTFSGIHEFIQAHRKVLPQALCILESTGGYEMRLLMRLAQASFAVHRANTRHVKQFIRSLGN